MSIKQAIEALPPLPDPDHSLDCGTQPFFTADQMREYALAALRSMPAEPVGENQRDEADELLGEAIELQRQLVVRFGDQIKFNDRATDLLRRCAYAISVLGPFHEGGPVSPAVMTALVAEVREFAAWPAGFTPPTAPVPAEPVGQTYYKIRNDSDGKRVLSAFIYEAHHDLPSGSPLYATPHTEAVPVRMSEAEIDKLYYEYSFNNNAAEMPGIDWRRGFARAVEQATAARLGVKVGDV